MVPKDKQILESNIMDAISNYVYKYKEDYFTCIARIKVSQKKASVKITKPDASTEDIVLLAIQEYCNTDKPEIWAAHNTTAYEIAKFSVQLATILKTKNKKNEK